MLFLMTPFMSCSMWEDVQNKFMLAYTLMHRDNMFGCSAIYLIFLGVILRYLCLISVLSLTIEQVWNHDNIVLVLLTHEIQLPLGIGFVRAKVFCRYA